MKFNENFCASKEKLMHYYYFRLRTPRSYRSMKKKEILVKNFKLPFCLPLVCFSSSLSLSPAEAQREFVQTDFLWHGTHTHRKLQTLQTATCPRDPSIFPGECRLPQASQ